MSDHIDIKTLNPRKVKLCDDCFYNKKRKIIIRNENEQPLREKYWKVLEYLIEHNGWGCSDENLYNLVHEEDLDATESKQKSLQHIITFIRNIIGVKKIISFDEGSRKYVLELPKQDISNEDEELSEKEQSNEVELTESCFYDKAKNKVIRYSDGTEIRLTNYESEILQYLIENIGDVCTYEEIYLNCWGESYFDNNLKKTISTHIINLRGKIGDVDRSVIKNSYSGGYELNKISPQEIKDRVSNMLTHNAQLSADMWKGDLKQFEDTILSNATKSVKSYIQYEISEELLPTCTVAGRDYKNLYEYFKNVIENNKLSYCTIIAEGGSGKTSSLLYICKKIIEDKKSGNIIPVFVQMKKVDDSRENPIGANICKQLMPKFNSSTEMENRFLDDLVWYLNENNKKMLLILDGCNETREEALKDIQKIVELPNVMLIASSRTFNNSITIVGGNKVAKLHSLKERQIKKYLEMNDIAYSRHILTRMKSPIFVCMYASICKSKNEEILDYNTINRAELIGEYLSEDVKRANVIKGISSEELLFNIEILLPLLAMYIFFESKYEDHARLVISKDKIKEAINGVIDLLADEELCDEIIDKYDIDLELFDRKYIRKSINDIAVRKLGLLKKENEEEIAFCWSHECYRDWFVAKGLDVIRKYSKKLSDQYMERFIEDEFDYPYVYTNKKDFSAYYTASFYAELIGKDALTTIKDIRYHKLVRRIAFFADDLGESDIVVEYSNYTQARENNAEFDIPAYTSAVTLSGIACAQLKLENLYNRHDCDSILAKSYESLVEAKNKIEKVIGCEINIDDIKENLLEIKPSEIFDYYEEHSEYFNSVFLNTQFDDRCGTKDILDVIALYARVYGNLGLYYRIKYELENNTEYLLMAHKMRIAGLVIKYYVCEVSKKETASGSKPEEALALSYRAIGADKIISKDYDLAIEYFEFSMSQYESTLNDMLAGQYIARCKISQLDDCYSEEILKEIAIFEGKALPFFTEQKMISQIKVAFKIVAKLVSLSVKEKVSEETEEIVNGISEYCDIVCWELNIGDSYVNIFSEQEKSNIEILM